jgi:hypothetical protein
MMQPCASAAKLRGGGSILKDGAEAMVVVGAPPPRIVIGSSSNEVNECQNFCECYFLLPVMTLDAEPHPAAAHRS